MAVVLLWLPPTAFAEQLSDLQRCLLEVMETASDEVTMGDMRNKCLEQVQESGQAKTVDSSADAQKKDKQGAVDQRLTADEKHTLEPFSLMAHKPNYFLVAAHNYSGINEEPFREQFEDDAIELSDTEARFQISIKFPLLVDLFKKKVDIYGAYTNRSFWQLYSGDISAPFRETNHEPEIWLQKRNDWSIFGLKNSANAFGFVHQSNGRGGVLSRSWNRLFANFLFERNNFAMSLKPWYRIEEPEEDDDNPDITDYLGYGEFRTAYKWHRNTFSLMLRNILESSFSKGAVELSWSFPLWKYRYVKGYVQYFNGYGESLIDYDQHANTLGVGLLLTDWL